MIGGMSSIISGCGFKDILVVLRDAVKDVDQRFGEQSDAISIKSDGTMESARSDVIFSLLFFFVFGLIYQSNLKFMSHESFMSQQPINVKSSVKSFPSLFLVDGRGII